MKRKHGYLGTRVWRRIPNCCVAKLRGLCPNSDSVRYTHFRDARAAKDLSYWKMIPNCCVGKVRGLYPNADGVPYTDFRDSGRYEAFRMIVKWKHGYLGKGVREGYRTVV